MKLTKSFILLFIFLNSFCSIASSEQAKRRLEIKSIKQADRFIRPNPGPQKKDNYGAYSILFGNNRMPRHKSLIKVLTFKQDYPLKKYQSR